MMLGRAIKKGSVDQSVVIRIIDSADGTPETGVVFNTAGIDLEYRREGAVSTDITEATLSALSDAHTDGGFLHIGNGYYRLDVPDAAFASGANGVLIHGTVTGMVVIGCYHQLVDYDPQDTVRLGLTALPNAAAEAAGGLFTRGTGAGQINQDANGRVDTNIAAVSADPTAADNLEQAFDDTAGTVPWLGIIDQGTAQSASATGLVLRSAAAFADDTLIGCILSVLGSTQGYWQHRIITDNALTGDSVVVDAWTVTPSGTITYKIWGTSPPSATLLVPANVTQFGGAAGTFASGRPETNTTHWGGTAVASAVILAAANIASDAITAAKIATDALTDTKFASGALTAAKFASGAFDAVWTVAVRLLTAGTNIVLAKGTGVTGFNDPTVGAIADAVFDEDLTGHTLANTAGRRLAVADSGTAQAGAAGTVTLRSGASSTNDIYNNHLIQITGGTGVGQARVISDYVGSSKVASVAENWTTNPDSTSEYQVLPGAAATVSGTVNANVVSEDLDTRFPVGTVVDDVANSASTFKTNLTSGTTDFWKDALLLFTGGTLEGQVKKVSAYNGTTKFVTVTGGFTAEPTAGDTFALVNR